MHHYPADGPGSTFSNTILFSILALVPGYITYKLGLGLKTWVFFFDFGNSYFNGLLEYYVYIFSTYQ